MINSLSKRLVAFSGRRAVRRTLAGLAILLLLYSVAGYFVLPAVIESQAKKFASEELHREMTVGQVTVNPFALTLTVRELKLKEPQGNAVFASFDALTVNLSAESVLRAAPVVQQVRMTKPYLHLVRTDAHRYNLDDIVALFAKQPASPEPARFSFNNIQIEQGRIEFDDRPAKVTHTVDELRLGVPFVSSLPSDVTVFVEPLLSAKVNGAPISLNGRARPFADPKDAVVQLNLNGLDLNRYLEYLPFQPRFKVPGARLDLNLSASFRQFSDTAPALVLSGTAAVRSLRIVQDNGKPLLKLPELTLTLGDADLLDGRFELARVVATGLEADLTRSPDGRLNLQQLLPPARAGAAAAPGQAAAKPAALKFALDHVELRDASLRYADQQPARPMRAGVDKLNLSIRKVEVDTARRTVNIAEVVSDRANVLLAHDKPQAPAPEASAGHASSRSQAVADTGSGYAIQVARVSLDNWAARIEDHGQPQPAVTTIAPLSLSLRQLSTASPGQMELKATVNQSGQVAASGPVGFAPLHADLALDLKNVDLLPLQPYITDRVNLRLTRAAVSAKGRLQLDAGTDGALQGGFKGNMSLDNVATVDKVSGDDFLRWKSLAFGAIDLRLAPFALAVDQAALSDFFARVIIDPSGRINLQDITRAHASDRRSLTAPGERRSAPPPAPVRAEMPQRTAAQQEPAAAMPPITIRKLTLAGGRVRFTDDFIKPNYSASLVNFGGVVSGLSSDPSASATVDLRGEVNRAPLSVAGRINPLRRDLFLDIKANVRGMELAPLSGYSDRYIGYGIEKGKLSFDVAYRVENRRLSADNRLLLDQLTFGPESDNAEGSRLPVRLAMALLSDRNGVVDISVPVEGSLDDPQFSIGAIVLRVIGNAIAKAVTQPFKLLSALFAGGAELSSFGFEPGRAAIGAPAEGTLRPLAKALAERPALTLEITGRADPQTDMAGIKRASVERKVRALKFKDLTARGEAVEFGSVTVRPDEYPDLLMRAYRDEKFEKPRNLVGLPKALPVAEMEQLMIANTAVDDDDLIALANRRAQAAKDWLIKFGQVPGDRIFLLASKSGGQAGQGSSAGAAPARVDFSLR